MRCTFHVLLAFAIALAALPAFASDPPFYGPQLEGFAYPHPVKRFEFDSQQQKLSMAYMDVAATAEPNGRTVLLLHGKNFCAATWESAIAALRSEEHTSELQSLMRNSYAVFCLKKKNK